MRTRLGTRILLIRFDNNKWLAVTKEGNAELLDMAKQRTVKLAWVPGLDGRGRGGQHQWELARQRRLLGWVSFQTFIREACILADVMEEEVKPLVVSLTEQTREAYRQAATAPHPISAPYDLGSTFEDPEEGADIGAAVSYALLTLDRSLVIHDGWLLARACI